MRKVLKLQSYDEKRNLKGKNLFFKKEPSKYIIR